jgi:hypothetical protein
MVKSGALWSLVEGQDVVSRIEDIPVVRMFPNVFPTKLPGLPLGREQDFRIELVPGMRPIYKNPI